MTYEEDAKPTPQLERAREAFDNGHPARAMELISNALKLHKSISLAELEEYQSILSGVYTQTTGRAQSNCARLAAKVTARRVELGDTTRPLPRLARELVQPDGSLKCAQCGSTQFEIEVQCVACGAKYKRG